jgi:hypothetical protein
MSEGLWVFSDRQLISTAEWQAGALFLTRMRALQNCD